MTKQNRSYHHGNLAESLLNAVDELATKFGLEAVTLRACAKIVGVSPSSAFRHYSDKRALLTAFASRALHQLSDSLQIAKKRAQESSVDEYLAVGLAYVQFAIEKPAFFRAMWREETIYIGDESYVVAANRLRRYMQAGFAGTLLDDDPHSLSVPEVLAWSSVHGLATLFTEGALGNAKTREQKLDLAQAMIESIILERSHN
jgi:AcrR family transcriptional regulator